MANTNLVIKSICNQIESITNIIYQIYSEKEMSELCLSFLKKVSKRLQNCIKVQETKIQKRKARRKAKI